MKNKQFKLSILLVISFGFIELNAQESISTTGNNSSGSGGSISYSVGQVLFNTNSGTSGSVIQGVQQPFEISVLSGTEEIQGINLSFAAFPNPTQNLLTLKIENLGEKLFIASLFDLNGSLVSSQNITTIETIIPMEQYSSATYFLKITSQNKEIKTFKIIKN